jgi:YHS domain-containing protein
MNYKMNNISINIRTNNMKLLKSLTAVKFSVILLATLFAATVNAQAKSSCFSSDNDNMSSGKSEIMDTAMSGHKGHNMGQQTDKAKNGTQAKAWNAVCPVGKDKVDPKATTVNYKGKVYGFCCNSCVSKFVRAPEKYAKNLSKDGKTFIGGKAKTMHS